MLFRVTALAAVQAGASGAEGGVSGRRHPVPHCSKGLLRAVAGA